MKQEVIEALEKAVAHAFEKAGLECFKRTSLFMSNRLKEPRQ